MHKLFFIFLMFANSEILANKVILQEINDTNKNEYELSFKLDKVALIKSESFDDEPKIILKIESAKEFKQIAQNQSKLIKSFSSSVEDDGISIIIELDQLVKWTKPTQEKMTDHVKMSMHLIPDKKLDKNPGNWICGEELSYADIYLFPTVIRWELIYRNLFKCTEKEISEFKNIIKWRSKFFT